MNEQLLTKEELAVRLNLTTSKIDTLRKQNMIPHVKGFKRPFKYNLEAVNEAVKAMSK